MGYELHVATKHEVCWGKSLGFRFNQDKFIHILDIFDVERYCDNKLMFDVEINRTSLDIALQEKVLGFSQLDESTQAYILDRLGQEFLLDRLGQEYMSLDKVRKLFEEMLKEADPNNDIIYCSFF